MDPTSRPNPKRPHGSPPPGASWPSRSPKTMTARREVDPEARRLLARAAEVERGPWPAGLAEYAATLTALSIRCEAKAGMAELLRWIGRVTVHPSWAECHDDALHDVVVRAAGQLGRFRARLDPARRPNLRSMLARAVAWQARTLHTSHHGRHAAHRDHSIHFDRLGRIAGPHDPEFEAAAREIWGLLDAAVPVDRALMLVGLGCSVAEAARTTGASRTRIYARRAAFAGICRSEGSG